jgi:hypothetical protein
VDGQEDWQTVLRDTQAHCDQFVGLTEAEARVLADQLGLTLRVLAPGDALSLDMRPQRMTVIVSEGTATRAFGG